MNTPLQPSTPQPASTANTMASEPVAHGVAAGSAVLALSATTLSACGGGGGGGGSDATPSSPISDADAARFLQQAQFSSTTNEINALRSKGTYAAWLDAEFDRPQGQTGWDWLEQRGYYVPERETTLSNKDLEQYCFHHYPGDFMFWQQLMSAPDPVRKRCALALSEFFVVSYSAVDFVWRSFAMAHYWDTLVGQAFGNFRDLLEAVTLHPTMGYFLNTKGNQKAAPATGRVPDENYAREVMQLFTIGLYQLNLDGSVKTDSKGQKLESYTPTDVSNLAKVFTGYDFYKPKPDERKFYDPIHTAYVDSYEFARQPMQLTEDKHAYEEVSFLGTTIAASATAQQALTQALDTLFNHPNTGPFFARQMIQRLVTSEPSPAYVARVASTFNDNGSGERGDLKAVWKAILLDTEARDPQAATNIYFGKLREPMLRFIQWARTFGATSAAGSWKIFDTNNTSTQLGQSPLRAPSVFNFFRPGYVPPGTALVPRGSTAPEFQLANETTLGAYLNFMQDIIRNGVNCHDPKVPWATYNSYSRDVQATYTPELALVTQSRALVQHLSLVLCAGQISTTSQNTMVAALDATPVTASSTKDAKLDRIASAVLMVMACPEYLIQK